MTSHVFSAHGSVFHSKKVWFLIPQGPPGHGNIEKTKENEGFGSLRPSPKPLIVFVFPTSPSPTQTLESANGHWPLASSHQHPASGPSSSSFMIKFLIQRKIALLPSRALCMSLGTRAPCFVDSRDFGPRGWHRLDPEVKVWGSPGLTPWFYVVFNQNSMNNARKS